MKTTKPKKSTKKPSKTAPDNKIVICTVLRIGDWKHDVPYIQRRLIITEALNKSVSYKKGFRILGYLIAKKEVILVLESKESLINVQVRTLSMYVKCLAEEYINNIKPNTKELTLKRKIYAAIFHGSPLYNNILFHLITGRVVNLEYYSSRLARLKDILRGYEYCSVKDYHCGHSIKEKGACKDTTAVRVTLMPLDFWEKHLVKSKTWDKNGWVKYTVKT